MKLVARAVTALALLAFATPALPCGDRTKATTVSNEKGKASSTVAKSGEKKAPAPTKGSGESRPATAAN